MTERVSKSVPLTFIGGNTIHPSGSASGPNGGLPSSYASTHSVEGGSAIDRWRYASFAVSLRVFLGQGVAARADENHSRLFHAPHRITFLNCHNQFIIHVYRTRSFRKTIWQWIARNRRHCGVCAGLTWGVRTKRTFVSS